MDPRFCHGWIALALPIAMMGHSIGQICDTSYLPFLIPLMMEMCQENDEY